MPDDRKIKTAVITGEHEYDVVAFQTMLRSLSSIDCYPQNMWDFVTDSGKGVQQYDVLLFFNFHLTTPGASGDEFGLKMKQVLEGLGKTDQGIFVLHHALVAFPDWPLWTQISGLPQRADVPGVVDQSIRIEIADPDHPITNRLAPWTMIDETYVTADALDDSHVLLTTNHSRCMKTIAWTRQHGRARVFCYQSGHDDQTFTDPNYRQVLEGGIQWAAGAI
jgi:trehalose utilization protein